MASLCSVLVVVEYIFGNLRKRELLLRLVIDKDIVIINDGHSVQFAKVNKRIDLSEELAINCWLCKCTNDWISGSCPIPSCCWLLRFTPYAFSCFAHEITKSQNFRNNVIDRIHLLRRDKKLGGVRCCHSSSHILGGSNQRFHVPLRIVLRCGDFVILDKAWMYRLERLMQEKLTLDEMMAGLSTLGGAFSSLGDELVKCAQTAGRISLHQLQLAMKLGDHVLISKCKLFLALSLMQQGHIAMPKRLIREQFEMTKRLPESQKDIRLENMCKGAWAKLQYIHRQRKLT